MPRALIVGCGCRGTTLASRLGERGWRVRGTSRRAEGVERIERAGFEAVRADPGRAGTIVEQFADVTVLVYLMGTAAGGRDAVAALHGPRLDRILEKAVDSPLRGIVYEAAGTVVADRLRRGGEAVAAAGERWRIPTATIDAHPADHDRWLDAAAAAVTSVVER